MSASPNLDGAGVDAPAPLIRATQPRRELRQHRPPQLARRGSGGDPDSADRRLPADGGTGVDARSSPTQVEILDGQVYPQPSVPDRKARVHVVAYLNDG